MFYLVNKPYGITSNLVIKILKRVLNVGKIGFAGTLDPCATGLMLIGTHGSSRLFPMTEDWPKTYHAHIRLDGTTASYDLEHPIETINIDKCIIDSITLPLIDQVIKTNFTGSIAQTPPAYSATWISGTRSYERIRKGEVNLEIPTKTRYIYDFKIIKYTWPLLEVEITVSHGTYIRSIAHDLWEKLQTGGYLESLTRLSLWPLNLTTPRNWIQHNDILYSPITHEEVFPEIDLLELNEREKQHLRIGSTPIQINAKDSFYFVKYWEREYGLIEVIDGMMFPRKNWV